MNEYNQLQSSVMYRDFILQHKEYAAAIGYDVLARGVLSDLMHRGFLFEEFLAELYCYA